MKNYTNKVKERLDEYIGFDSDEFFYSGDAKVFGGAVRDSIADMEIHDVDIMCGAETNGYLYGLLTEKGYVKLDKLGSKDMNLLYKEISIINEPITYMKDGKFIQLIRPVVPIHGYSKGDRVKIMDRINQLIRGVDLSCCGVSYDKHGVREDYPNAISHCECKVFEKNESHVMRNKSRYGDRVYKLKNRGWEELEGETTSKRYEREVSINQLDNLF